ncbi:DUF6891 domain-containing protein [Paludisphaera rhizosphaerae]|uniref:DUF6891 domain-containing protein n=1 Tax=Paludisphaera rhizosphaerae TaxID=2711216 RepID=UPI0013EAF6AA|nr:hypothetical protein [Paludisphaera rhizosphaerae]
MGEEREWNDAARDDLREQLRSAILGEMRLAKRDHEDILQVCSEVYIEDAPEAEREEFTQFSAEEIERAADRQAAERLTWLGETDCDRLDHVEAALQERGILLWQASPCCDNCTLSEISDRIAEIDNRAPGFRGRVRGYAFFIDQNLPSELADDIRLHIYLGFGWISPDGSSVGPEDYHKYAVEIGQEVSRCLQDAGFEVDWSGDLSRKIGVSLNWQRRTMLR